jgi:hypothetical protein
MCETCKDGCGTCEMLISAFGEETLSCIRTFEWFDQFKKCRISVEDDPSHSHRIV